MNQDKTKQVLNLLKDIQVMKQACIDADLAKVNIYIVLENQEEILRLMLDD